MINPKEITTEFKDKTNQSKKKYKKYEMSTTMLEFF